MSFHLANKILDSRRVLPSPIDSIISIATQNDIKIEETKLVNLNNLLDLAKIILSLVERFEIKKKELLLDEIYLKNNLVFFIKNHNNNIIKNNRIINNFNNLPINRDIKIMLTTIWRISFELDEKLINSVTDDIIEEFE